MDGERSRRAGDAIPARLGNHARERRPASSRPGPIAPAKPTALRDEKAGGVRGDAARRRRHDVRRHAARARHRARPGDRPRAMGVRSEDRTATSPTATSRAAASSTWLDESAPADAACRRRIFVATAQSQLFALDARDRRPVRGIRARRHRRSQGRPAHSAVRAAGVFDDVAAGRRQRRGRHRFVDRRQQPPGRWRAARCARFDARTGALNGRGIRFRRTRNDPAYREWRGAMAHKGGGANAWSVLAADPERDLVFVPTGSAAPDYYGALRLGDNRYANSIVALQRVDRPRGVVVPDRASRSVGLRQRVAAGARHHHARWRRASRPCSRRPRTGCCSCSTARPACRSSRSKNAPVPASDIPGEEASRDAAVHHGHAAAQPASLHGRRGVGHDRRRSRGVPRRDRGTCATKASSRRRARAARS